jgi:hypothetical protein
MGRAEWPVLNPVDQPPERERGDIAGKRGHSAFSLFAVRGKGDIALLVSLLGCEPKLCMSPFSLLDQGQESLKFGVLRGVPLCGAKHGGPP